MAAVAFRTTSVFISETEESAGMACRLSAPQPRRVLDTPESSEVYTTFVQSGVKLLFRHAVLFSLCSLARRMVCRERYGQSSNRFVITQIALNHNPDRTDVCF